MYYLFYFLKKLRESLENLSPPAVAGSDLQKRGGVIKTGIEGEAGQKKFGGGGASGLSLVQK